MMKKLFEVTFIMSVVLVSSCKKILQVLLGKVLKKSPGHCAEVELSGSEAQWLGIEP